MLFGDGCAAVVLQATENDDEGHLADKLGCYADARHILRVRGHGTTYANRNVSYGDTQWDFDGQEIFKRAVHGMGEASATRCCQGRLKPADVHLVVPHQANLRIIEFVAKRSGIPMERVFLTITSTATCPRPRCRSRWSRRSRRVACPPHALMLMPAFGGGLTWCAHLVRFGERTTPIDVADVDLPPCERTALDIVNALRAAQGAAARRSAGRPSPDPIARRAGSSCGRERRRR